MGFLSENFATLRLGCKKTLFFAAHYCKMNRSPNIQTLCQQVIPLPQHEQIPKNRITICHQVSEEETKRTKMKKQKQSKLPRASRSPPPSAPARRGLRPRALCPAPRPCAPGGSDIAKARPRPSPTLRLLSSIRWASGTENPSAPGSGGVTSVSGRLGKPRSLSPLWASLDSDISEKLDSHFRL